MSRYRGSDRFCRYTVSPLRKLKFAPGVEGEGIITSMPDPYYGSMYVDGTGIVFDQIVLDVNPDGEMAPTTIKAHAEVRVSGGRRYTNLPITETRLHITWHMRFADGSEIPYHGEISYERRNEVKNPYTDIIGITFGAIIDWPEEYELIGRAYVATDTPGQCLMAEQSVNFTVEKMVGDLIYWNAVDGDNDNDGRHPLTIPALTNATYTESTGILSQTGAFTDLSLEDETGKYPINTRNFIFINGYWQCHIAEKIDNDNIRISDPYKLGSDLTGLTSSNGPKQFYTGNSFTNNTNRINFLSGNGGDGTVSYDLTQPMISRGKDGHYGAIGYDGTPRVTVAVGSEANVPGLISQRQTGSTPVAPETFVIDNVLFDADWRTNFVDGSYSESADTRRTLLMLKNLRFIKGKSRNAVSFTKHSGKEMHIFEWGNYVENVRQHLIEGELESEVTLGQTQIRVSNADLSVLGTAGSILVGTVRYVFDDKTLDGSTWVLHLATERDPKEIIEAQPVGTAVVVSERRSSCEFHTATSYIMLGTKWNGNSDRDVYEHYCYPSIYGDYNIMAWCAGTADNDTGYMFNTNNDSGGNVRGVTQFQNYAVGCRYFSDASNSNNTLGAGNTYTLFASIDNAGAPARGFVFQYTALDYFFALNEVWRATPTANPPISAYFKAVTDTDGPLPAGVEWDYTVERNISANYTLWEDNNQPKIFNLELLFNEIIRYGASELGMYMSIGTPNQLAVVGNNIDMPDRLDELRVRYNGSNLTIAQLNTNLGSYGSENTSIHRGYVDPLNGDFSTTPAIPELILGGGTKYATISGFDQASTNDKISAGEDFDLSYKFTALDTFDFLTILGPSSGTNILRTTSATSIRWADNAGTFNFTVPEMIIGVEYEHIWRRRSGVLMLEHNGDVNPTTASTNVIMNLGYVARAAANIEADRLIVRDLSLSDLTTPFTITYNIDGEQIPTPPATSVTVPADISTGTLDSHSITYHGIDADDWV